VTAGRESYPLPMFPLQHVVFPATVVPLRIFEPRYVALIEDCLRSAGVEGLSELGTGPEFGIVLIERGREVGGGDARFGVGVVVRILEIQATNDGGYELIAVAMRRITVDVWLPDDPYPQALVTDLVDTIDAEPDQVTSTHTDLRRLLAKCAEAEWPAPPATIELSTDPDTLLWHLCAVAPIGPLDDYALLSAADGPARLRRLRDELADVDRLVSNRLSPT
jgi:uncharacterized protein